MTDPTSYEVSQKFSVPQPKTSPAYLVSCDEWTFLKAKIARLPVDIDWYQNVASLLLGAAASTLIGLLTGAVPGPQQSPAAAVAATPTDYRVIAWAVVAVTAIGGALSFFFAWQQRGTKRGDSEDVTAQMDLIAKKFEQ